jgi:hypothetical protein
MPGRPKGSGKPKPLTTTEKAARYDRIIQQARERSGRPKVLRPTSINEWAMNLFIQCLTANSEDLEAFKERLRKQLNK